MKLEVGLITVLVFGIISDITAETLEGSGNELNTDDSDDIYLNEDTVGSNQASEPDELYFDDEQRVESSSTTTKSTGTGNKLGVPKRTSVDANHNKSEDDPKDAGDDEDDKKDARQTKAQASKSDPDDPGKEVKEEIVLGSLSHPGIMAALIGGGLVGLLCAILLIIFIVYRMRKKDEGSYPLDDGKPLKGYAYSKAPSQEFYA